MEVHNVSTISLSEFEANSPASSETVESTQQSLGLRLPDDYLKFMQGANGGEGSVGGDSFVMLWQLEELEEFNRDYEVAEYCSGILLFGSSGGGEAFGFDTRQSPWTVIQVPFVGMDESMIEKVGDSFTDFLERLASGAVET